MGADGRRRSRAEQVEEVGQHLLKRQLLRAALVRPGRLGDGVRDRSACYGIPIVAGRPVGYGKINPAEAREIFLRSALVEGLWRTRHHFFADNQALRAEAEALEERTRRRDLVVDDETIFAFYDARVPGDITSVAHFDAWWKKARHADAGSADHDPGRPHHRCRRRTSPTGVPCHLDDRRLELAGRATASTRRADATG